MRANPSHASVKSLLRWCSGIFLIAGTALIICYGWIWIEGQAFQAVEAHRYSEPGFPQPTSGQSDCPTASVLQDESIGRIEIARVGLSVVVLEGDDARTLRRGAGRIPGTARPGQPGNVAIAAHRDMFFRKLRDVRKGDLIQFITPVGSYRYNLESTEIVAPTQTDVLNSTAEPTLTLITCYPFDFIGAAPNRFVVRARQVSFEPAVTLRDCPALLKGR
jgi:sortase A